MTKRHPRRRAPHSPVVAREGNHPRSRITIIAATSIVICVLLSVSTVAGWNGLFTSARSPVAAVAMQAPPPSNLAPSNPAKEYIHAGGRMLATEELQTVLTPIADAYVQGGGGFNTTNFGTAAELQIKRALNPGSGTGRQAYLRFNTSSVTGTLTKAVLRVYGKLIMSSTPNIPCAVFPVSADWGETTLTWDNKPGPNVPVELTRVTITDGTLRWYEFDITAFISEERAAGRTTTGVLLRNMSPSDTDNHYTVFNSKEATTNQPQLVLTPQS